MHTSRVFKLFQPFECKDLIRVGKDNDGGYLVNKFDIDKTNRLISLGVGGDVSFEQGMSSLGIEYISAYDEKASKEVKEYFTGARTLRPQNITKNNFEETIVGINLFLKCDIEGGEYDLLDLILANDYRFTGMVIEFHSLSDAKNLDKLFNFIAKTKLKLVHTHVNNYFYYIAPEQNIPDVVELTFTSSNNIWYNPDLKLPHPLDMPNNPNDQQFELVFS
ncbi:MAG: hypothetical protein EBU08_04790 [Micrococcales bacterium]|nr:hypothetical protein [Micrococcales bacterium]